jgi:hypothetical protein
MTRVKIRIDFIIALVELQGLLGKPLFVFTSFGNLAGGSSFESRLERIETLPTLDESVDLHFANGAIVDLAPGWLRPFKITNVETGASWLSFEVRDREVVEITPVWTDID